MQNLCLKLYKVKIFSDDFDFFDGEFSANEYNRICHRFFNRKL